MSRPAIRNLVSGVLRLVDGVAAPRTAHAHCDIPCGIYDPHAMQIAALTIVRMNQLIEGIEGSGNAQTHSLVRYTHVKEEHAEIVKKEARIIFGDYFKPEHVEKHSGLPTLTWNILKTAGKARQNIDMAAAQELVGMTQQFAEIFWDTKGVPTKKQPSNQAVGGELVVPAN